MQINNVEEYNLALVKLFQLEAELGQFSQMEQSRPIFSTARRDVIANQLKEIREALQKYEEQWKVTID